MREWRMNAGNGQQTNDERAARSMWKKKTKQNGGQQTLWLHVASCCTVTWRHVTSPQPIKGRCFFSLAPPLPPFLYRQPADYFSFPKGCRTPRERKKEREKSPLGGVGSVSPNLAPSERIGFGNRARGAGWWVAEPDALAWRQIRMLKLNIFVLNCGLRLSLRSLMLLRLLAIEALPAA